jgi:pyrroloquinoline quinone biosynthesis protein D
LGFDARRSQWVVQAPERVFVLDEIALEVLQRCDGRPLKGIIDDLARTFDAPREEIAHDVAVLIEDLGRRGVLVS